MKERWSAAVVIC